MRRILRNFGLLIIIAMCVAVSGCPGGDRQVERLEDVEEMSQGEINNDVSAVDHESSVSFSESVLQLDVPADWPEYVPIMPGSEVMMVTTSADGARLIMLECPAELSNVDSYYSEALADYGWVGAGGRFEMRDSDGFTVTYERDTEVLRLQSRRGEGGTELTMSIFSQSVVNQNKRGFSKLGKKEGPLVGTFFKRRVSKS